MKTNRNIFLVALVVLLGQFTQGRAQSDYKIAEQDSLALVAFYHATDGPNWISNQDGFGKDDLSSEWQEVYTGGFNKWLEGPVKDWFGVAVEPQAIPNSTEFTYRVVALWPVIGRRTDGQNRLNGYLPKEMGLLTALRDFKINGNDGFKGTEIPDEIYHTTLRFLDIESAYFEGDISDALRNCTSIQKMNFRYNNINYLPTFDFLDRDALYNFAGTHWIYSTQIPLSNFEKTIDYFYTISDNPKEFEIQMRDQTNVGDELEIVAPEGTAVDMECTAAGEKEDFITYQWYKGGLSKFGKTKRKYSISSVKASDYGDYTVKITNDYVKSYDGNSNWGEVYTKPIHLVPAPVAPVVQWVKTSYNGKELQVRFSKPMPETINGLSDFVVKVGTQKVNVVAASTSGRLSRDVYLQLESPIALNEQVSLAYDGSALVDENGGVLVAFADSTVTNLVRQAPSFVSARTTKDGSGIEVVFDKYIDVASINVADFTIKGDVEYSISNGILQSGELDAHISKTILLLLEQPLSNPDEDLTVAYAKGELSALYGGVCASFLAQNVANELTLKVTPVTLVFEDGTARLSDVLLKGSWGINAIQLYDDGTNGDAIAGDHFWSATPKFVDDTYTWEVYSRTTETLYDTSSVVDAQTGIITQTITPQTIISDSILSEGNTLAFAIANSTVTGDLSYGIANIDVIFNLKASTDNGDYYLMGIGDDWGVGLALAQDSITKVYSDTLYGYSLGDVILYNYREGDYWENIDLQSRTYTVVDGENHINDVFGDMTAIVEKSAKAIGMYPNPVKDELHLKGVGDFTSLRMYSLSGQLVRQVSVVGQDFSVDVSDLREGVYILLLNGEGNSTFSEKFFKLN